MRRMLRTLRSGLLVTFGVLFGMATCCQEPKLVLPNGHASILYDAIYSPDGKFILTHSWDQTPKIWESGTGRLVFDLIGHTAGVKTASFSKNGKKIVTGSDDATAKIWEAQSGKLLLDLKGHRSKITSVAFSDDGKKVATAGGFRDGSIKIWDAETGKLLSDLIGHGDRNWINIVQFSGNGKIILSASSDQTAKIWNTETGELVTTLKGHRDELSHAVFSPDENTIATASKDNTLILWDTKTGKQLSTLKGHSSIVEDLAFSPNGNFLASGSLDGTARMWDVKTGSLKSQLVGHSRGIKSIDFSPNGNRIVTASDDNTARIWNATDGSLLNTLRGHTQGIVSAHFRMDGKNIVTASLDTTARTWDALTGKPLTQLKGRIAGFTQAAYSADGRMFLTVNEDRTIKVWNAQTGRLLWTLRGHSGWIFSASFSPDGEKIVSASKDNTARVWDVQTGKTIHVLKGSGWMIAASFSPDGKKIATGSRDNTAKIWDAESGTLLFDLTGHTDWVESLKFSPDGKILATSGFGNRPTGKNTWIWNVSTGRPMATLKGNKARFSPDGKTILTLSAENSVCIWETTSGTSLAVISAKGGGNLFFATYSPDGNSIATTDSYNRIRIWDVRTSSVKNEWMHELRSEFQVEYSNDGKYLLSTLDKSQYNYNANIWEIDSGKLTASLEGKSGIFSPNGKQVITLTSDNAAQVWETTTGKQLYRFFAVDEVDYLMIDKKGRYDGTAPARQYLYFACGTELVGLEQVKESLWVPNLSDRVLAGDMIKAQTIEEVGICGTSPILVENSSPELYQFNIEPQRGGVSEAVLYVNGIEARRLKTSQLIKNASGFTLSVPKKELSGYLISGKENQIAVKAYTNENGISSRGLIVQENKTKEPEQIPPNLYAVMVGVSDYQGGGLDLKYAAKDASDLSVALTASARKLLNTDNKEHVFVYNLTTHDKNSAPPNKQVIKRTIEEIGKKSKANDIVLIFFAGHGVMEGSKKQFYFLTADASESTAEGQIDAAGISTSELSDWMKPQSMPAQKRILIFDACNSGQAIKDLVKVGNAGEGYLTARGESQSQQIKTIESLNEKSGFYILAAAASNQSAYELSRYSQGLLTHCLLRTMKLQPDILEDDKFLNVGRWFNATEQTLTELARENGARQQPQIVTNTNFNIGVVDEEVAGKIRLPPGKPLFTSSNLQNADDRIAYDDLELSKLLDAKLSSLSARGSEGTIVYAPNLKSREAWMVSGRYEINDKKVIVRLNIRQNNAAPKFWLEEKGDIDKLEELAASMAEKVASLFK